MTIEVTFANDSLISPRTCSFAALSMMLLCSRYPDRGAGYRGEENATTLSRCRSRGSRATSSRGHHSSPQAASDALPGLGGHVAGFFDGVGIYGSGSVAGLP